MDKAGFATALWRARFARFAHRHPIWLSPARPHSQSAEAQIHVRFTNPSGRNIINPIRGSKRQVADIKSESRPASNRNQRPTSDWNVWPASSESASDASIGMGAAFEAGIKENFANAEITFDKFHVIKLANEAVDQVRREEARNNYQ
ncbi:MAG TPA: transposase, partial [Pseudolabrys sp.]